LSPQATFKKKIFRLSSSTSKFIQFSSNALKFSSFSQKAFRVSSPIFRISLPYSNFRNKRTIHSNKFIFNSVSSLGSETIAVGLEKKISKAGDGKTFPQVGQTVEVHYTGTFLDGKKFDSSKDRGTTFKFQIGKGKVIKGWDVGVSKMSIGEHARLTCGPQYAYGSRGIPGAIPENSTLIFDVELISIS